MATWPTTLPDPQSGTYVLRPVSQIMRSEMESGTARQRRITSARNDKVTPTWYMTDTQVAAFRYWFDTDISGGAGWFGVALAIGLGGKTSVLARFTGAPTITHAGGLQWTVSGELEVQG